MESITPAQIIEALSRGDIYPEYQAIRDINTGKLICVEQLARWSEGDKSISPGEFLPIAIAHVTDSGDTLMDIITLQFLEQARDALISFLAKKTDGSTTVDLQYITINISADQFINESFMQRVKEIIPPELVKYFTLELLETRSEKVQAQLEISPIMLNNALEDIKEHGFKLSLDDVGADFHTLQKIRTSELYKSLPIFNSIKIDAALVCPGGYGSRTLPNTDEINQIIAYMKSVRPDGTCCKVICEGVETNEQLAVLKEIPEITYVQGWLFSKAMPFDDIIS